MKYWVIEGTPPNHIFREVTIHIWRNPIKWLREMRSLGANVTSTTSRAEYEREYYRRLRQAKDGKQ